KPFDDDDDDSGVTSPNSGTPSPGSSACVSSDFDNLEETLKRCSVSVPRASEIPSIKGKVDVKVTASTPSTTPGGRIELRITLRNKTSDALDLYFSGDPTPRFELETTDSRGRRVDLPS